MRYIGISLVRYDVIEWGVIPVVSVIWRDSAEQENKLMMMILVLLLIVLCLLQCLLEHYQGPDCAPGTRAPGGGALRKYCQYTAYSTLDPRP